MRIEAIDGGFAREVRDLTLWARIDGDERAALRQAFREAGVLVFRRQALSDAELLEFGRAVGDPALYAETSWQASLPEVILLSNLRRQDGELLGGLANKALDWHTDQSYYATPVTGCFLYAVELPAEGGATSWASLYRAYETLPAELKRAIDGAVGTFSFHARVGATPGLQDDNHDRAKRLAATPDVKHPLVNVEPGTGRKALYIDPAVLIMALVSVSWVILAWGSVSVQRLALAGGGCPVMRVRTRAAQEGKTM